MIENVIDRLIENPTDDNKKNYERFVSEKEYELLVESENFKPKSQEYFSQRIKAFSFRKDCAVKLISKWIEHYNTSQGCPVSYADTLNIPFREIKKPK
jgi:hypothetical protein